MRGEKEGNGSRREREFDLINSHFWAAVVEGRAAVVEGRATLVEDRAAL